MPLERSPTRSPAPVKDALPEDLPLERSAEVRPNEPQTDRNEEPAVIASLRGRHKRVLMELQFLAGTIKPETAKFQSPLLAELFQRQKDIETQLIHCQPADHTNDETEAFEFYKLYSETMVLIHQYKEMSATESSPVTSQPIVIYQPLQVPMPSFDGKYENWPKFKSMFLDIINQGGSSDATKLYHLDKALTGSASGLISASIIANNNFESAWKILEARYENQRYLIDSHITGLLSLKPMQGESSKELRTLIETANRHIDGLVCTKNPVDGTSKLIITKIITSCLDIETRKAWEESLEHGEIPDLSKTLTFLTKRCEILERCTNESTISRRFNPKPSTSGVKVFTASTPSKPASCDECQDTHHLSQCAVFKNLNNEIKLEKLKQWNRCYNCLKQGHIVAKCYLRERCTICSEKHHTILHPEDVKQTEEQPSISLQAQIPSVSTVLLSTISVIISDGKGNECMARALLDNGSQSNFITTEIAQFLNLSCNSVNIPVIGICGPTNKRIKHMVQPNIKSRYTDYCINVNCLVLPKLASNIPVTTIDCGAWNIPAEIELADPNFNQCGKIDLILGAEYFFQFIKEGRLQLGSSLPMLCETVFGWIISGAMESPSSYTPTVCATSTCDGQIDKLLENFFAIEDVKEAQTWSAEELACEDHYKENTSRSPDGRYVVKFPFKENYLNSLGDSRATALRRFLALERRLQREPDTREAYVEFMNEYIQLGHMSEIQVQGLGPAYYLPHHPVFKSDSTTTKCRVVFDASCKTSSGLSLNDVLMIGPTIQKELTDILLRFRTHHIAISADVAKMYRQIWLHPDERTFQRVLWRPTPNEPIKEYCLNTVTYGTASAPFLAIRTLKQTTLDYKEEYPHAAARFEDFYVDDLISGDRTVEGARTLYMQTKEMYAKGGFTLRKWASNKPMIFNETLQDAANLSSTGCCNDSASTTTLGIIWDPVSDVLRFKINVPPVSEMLTRRHITSYIARIYDPLGIVDPVKVLAKQFLQRLWELSKVKTDAIGWDDEIPNDLKREWILFHSQLQLLRDITIPRVGLIGTTSDCQIHIFSDASLKGYGACCYLRSQTETGETSVKLFVSKSRVAPLSTKHTIARLELCASYLGTLLFKRVLEAVPNPSKVVFWTDSSTVIHWIRAPPNSWKPFVAHRVSKIQQTTSEHSWRHIAGVENPADLVSRGCLAKDLINNAKWWHGPSWLREPESNWPTPLLTSPDDTVSTEKRISTVSCANVSKEPHRIFSLYSTFSKTRRMLAYWIQYKNRLLHRTYDGNRLTTDDLQEAERLLCKWAQQDIFHKELKSLHHGKDITKSSSLKWFNPVITPDGVMRIGGRLQLASIPEDKKHPIIVPGHHPLASLIMKHYHLVTLHGQPQIMLNSVRQKYWITGGRNIAKQIFHSCHICFRSRPPLSQALMADLPASRVTPVRPFAVSGIDYCGPIFVKGKHRRAVPTKAFVAVFVCFTTRAVHLELVSDLTTEAFLAALRRFVARRGLVSELHSDNGTNFKGASNSLNVLYRLLHNDEHREKIDRWAVEKGIKWKFIPPRSPHFGGLWEAAVKSMKYHLIRVVGQASFTFEDITTLLAEIECCLNSRPITTLSNEPTDIDALTPGHFLIGEHMQQIPDLSLEQIPNNRLNHWRLVKKLARQFWDRWHEEYLQQLQARSKWHTSERSIIKPGIVVIVRDENLPSTRWPLAKVILTHPGKDGVIRVVTLRTSKGTEMVRPVVKICPLPTQDDV